MEYLVYTEHRNGNHIKGVLLENELRLWELQTTYESEVVIISGHCCEYCDNLNHKQLSFKEALQKQYLASKDCTRVSGCNCCYGHVALRDSNDRLIMKQVSPC